MMWETFLLNGLTAQHCPPRPLHCLQPIDFGGDFGSDFGKDFGKDFGEDFGDLGSFGSSKLTSKSTTTTTTTTRSSSSSSGASPESSLLLKVDRPIVQDSQGNKRLSLRFDCQQFKPEEISVKTVDNRLVVHVSQSQCRVQTISCRLTSQQLSDT